MMSAKTLYRKFISGLEQIPAGVTTLKVWIGEWYAIFRKRKIYCHIKWTRAQQKEFDTFWKTHYGKKISSRWHKLYQSINGIFNVAYIPEIIYTTKLEPKGNKYFYSKVLEDKNLVELLVDGENTVVPKTVIACCDGRMRTGNYKVISAKNAEALLRTYDRFVIKPTVGGSSGNGVEVVEVQENSVEIEKWIRQYNGNFIIQEAVHQHEAMAKLYPLAVNTIRVMTYLMEDDVYVASVRVRIGQGGKRVDNVHAGGMAVAVREDGRLDRFAYEMGYGNKTLRYESHPDTNVSFENYQIPYVDKIVSEAKKMHLKLPHIRYVSWDFSVNDQNQIVLIEVNLKGQTIWSSQIISGQAVFDERIWK
jgi:hypothetical protein